MYPSPVSIIRTICPIVFQLYPLPHTLFWIFFGGIDVTKWQITKEPSDTFLAFKSKAKENSLLGECNYFVDLEKFSSQADSVMDKRDTSK